MAMICGVGYAGALVSSLNVSGVMSMRRLGAQTYPVASMNYGVSGIRVIQTMLAISTMGWASGLTLRCSSTFISCTPHGMYYNYSVGECLQGSFNRAGLFN